MGQGTAGLGELSLPHGGLSSQPMLCLFSLLSVGKLRQGPARVTHLGSQPPGTAWASLTLKLPTGHFCPLTWLGWALLPPHQLCGWLVSMGHGCLWTGPQPHIPGGAKGLFVLAHSLPAQPSTHMKLWGHHTFLAPSHLPLPSIAFPKHSWSQAALGTILSRQSRIHAADGA